jgi:beta-lactamase regulating signal transducer with metallopeptidase domain
MLELLAESALRSIVLACAAWLGLTLIRVRNPQVHMTVWTAVLVVSMAMPGLTPWMRVTIPIQERPPQLQTITWTNIPWSSVSQALAPAARPAVAASPPPVVAAVPAHSGDWGLLAIGIYVVVGSAMLLRLFFGLMLMGRVVRAANPVREGWAAGADVRVSDVVVVPVTFASTILLPSASAAWSARKLKAVLLHEAAHVSNGDFYVLLLASINRALFWFNPLAWWLFSRLAELAEMVSDNMAIAGIDDRRCYADVLLEVAGEAQAWSLQDFRDLPSSLAMARPSTVSRRVQRILAATTVPAAICWRTRLLIAAAVVPLAALSAGTIAQSAVPAQMRPVADSPMDLSAPRLDRYVGQFKVSVTSVLTVTREGEQLLAQLTGQPKLWLIAVRDHEFVNELGDEEVTFVTDGDGPATEVVLREPNTGSRRAMRIVAATADEIEAAFQRRIAEVADRFRDQAPVPGGTAALRQMIEDLRRPAPSFGRMSRQLADKMHKQLPQLQSVLAALGAVESVFFRGVGPGGYDIYGVKFANGSGEVRIDLAADGAIKDAIVRPDGDGTLGGVTDCALEATLRSSRDTAPIRLSLSNRSGADLRLFSLDLGGQRTASGELGKDRSMEVWTSIARPLVVADQAGQCREIVLPGQLTRFHVVEPLRSGDPPPGPSTVRRMTPVPGSDEALRRHIEGVRRGDPDYDQMTPEAAAATRQLLPQQRAILSELGALRAMTFRGVTQAGDDMYGVLFANGSAVWQIGLADEGRIGSVALSP